MIVRLECGRSSSRLCSSQFAGGVRGCEKSSNLAQRRQVARTRKEKPLCSLCAFAPLREMLWLQPACWRRVGATGVPPVLEHGQDGHGTRAGSELPPEKAAASCAHSKAPLLTPGGMAITLRLAPASEGVKNNIPRQDARCSARLALQPCGFSGETRPRAFRLLKESRADGTERVPSQTRAGGKNRRAGVRALRYLQGQGKPSPYNGSVYDSIGSGLAYRGRRRNKPPAKAITVARSVRSAVYDPVESNARPRITGPMAPAMA
jgi:hypothetical protein